LVRGPNQVSVILISDSGSGFPAAIFTVLMNCYRGWKAAPTSTSCIVVMGSILSQPMVYVAGSFKIWLFENEGK